MKRIGLRASEMTERDRFLAVMEYRPVDRVPNHEVGVWPQSVERWKAEGCVPENHNWDWFTGDPVFNMDHREYIDVHFGMVPAFEYKVLERTDKYEVIQDSGGVVRRALIEGTVGGGRTCMDTFLRWPVADLADFRELAKRYDPASPERYPKDLKENLPRWRSRDGVLILGRNCQTLGFYWRAREWMGTEALSYAFYLQPELIEAMMAFIADFTIEVARPILDEIAPDYIFINEDMAMKTGPLLSPDLYRSYCLPHMKRMIEFFKGKGVRYVVVDTDGNAEPLFPCLLDAGVDAVWPLERASHDTDPAFVRKKYGKSLRLWGAVDKRELAKDFRAIDEHLMTLAPLIEEGGFIPTVDHTVPPDVSWDNLRYYFERKEQLLRGDFW